MSGGPTWPRIAANLAAHRTRLVNQLHAPLRDLIPGGADIDLTADRAARALTTVRPFGPAEEARKQIGRDLVAQIRQLDARLSTLSTQMTQAVAEHGSRLPDVWSRLGASAGVLVPAPDPEPEPRHGVAELEP